jgi:putative Mg2+ transporter-C (MgtC) family protein
MFGSVTDGELERTLRLLLAAFYGAGVGYERERSDKPAGLRTHILVALGAALFTVVSMFGFGDVGDPGRVAAQIVTGIGFLGAGAIIQSQTTVRGLTTAATVWVTAAIGMAVGVGMYLMSLDTTVITLAILQIHEVRKEVS